MVENLVLFWPFSSSAFLAAAFPHVASSSGRPCPRRGNEKKAAKMIEKLGIWKEKKRQEKWEYPGG